MKMELSDIINNLDILELKRYIKAGGDVSGISISNVTDRMCDVDEDVFWDFLDNSENALETLRSLDEKKYRVVEILLDNGATIDEDALISCYTFRCPKTAELILQYGENPNRYWGGSESCMSAAHEGLYNIGVNPASEVLVQEYIDTLKKYGGLKLNFDYVHVYYDDWQMQCCGEPFGVGDKVELLVEEDRENSKWYCTLHEEHHYTDQRQYILKGTVKTIEAEIVRPPHDVETHIDKLREYSELIPLSYADSYNGIPKDYKFLGYVVTCVDYTIEPIKPVMDIFIGLQASGKSSYVKPPKYYNYIHINLDTLKTRGRERRTLIETLRARKNCVIDNTNPSRKDREKYIIEAKKYGYDVVCHFFESKLKDCIARNEKREKPIPVAGLVDTSRRLELPSKEEGFSEMYFVRMVGDRQEESKWIEEQ